VKDMKNSENMNTKERTAGRRSVSYSGYPEFHHHRRLLRYPGEGIAGPGEVVSPACAGTSKDGKETTIDFNVGSRYIESDINLGRYALCDMLSVWSQMQ